jgi:hypothetical protein
MRKVLAVYPDGTEVLFKSASEASRSLGVTVQTVSLSCMYGYRSKGVALRYLDENDMTIDPIKRDRSPEYSSLKTVTPVVEILVGGLAPVLMAYLDERVRPPLTMHKIQIAVLQWYFTVGSKTWGIHIPSDRWCEAWSCLKRRKRRTSPETK